MRCVNNHVQNNLLTEQDDCPYASSMAEKSTHLTQRIKARADAEGISPATFGLKHFNNSRLYDRLLAGGTITLRTHEKLTAILDAGPPQKGETGAEAGE